MISEMKKYGYVFLSCYSTDLNKIIDAHHYDAIIPNEVIDTNKAGIYNFENIYNQVRTTKRALDTVSTQYVVKFRSDSFYSGIDYIVDSVKNNPDKLSTSSLNIHAEWPYQFCDHIIGSSTQNIKEMIQHAESIILNRDFIYDGIDTRLCPVVLLVTSWLKSKSIKGDNFAFEYFIKGDPTKDSRMSYSEGSIKVIVYKNYLQTVQNNINILNIEKMTPFYAKSNTLNRSFTNPSEFYVKDMETYIGEFIKLYSRFFK
jgi:hypothetical protein